METDCRLEIRTCPRFWQSKEKQIRPETDEAEIIRRVQAGEKDEYRHLVLLYKDLVFAMIQRQVGSAAVAEEIAQEVFVRAYFSIKNFRSESRFSTWLTRIALNQTSSYFSSKKFRTQQVTESFDPIRHEIRDDEGKMEIEEEQTRSKNLMKFFHLALAALKPKFRDIITICALEEKSYQEAAEILEIPIGTVRSRLNKARLLLATAITQLEA